MKLLVFFRNNSVKGAVSTLLLMLISCSEINTSESFSVEENKNSKKIETIKPEDYGEYHNSVLSVFLQRNGQNQLHSKEKLNAFRSLEDFRKLMEDIKQTVDADDMTLIDKNDFETSMDNIEKVFKSFEGETYRLDYYSVTERLFEIQTSKRLASLLSEFLYGNYTYSEITKKIDLFEREYDLSSIEKDQIVKFKVTLNASKELWEFASVKNSTSKWACDPQEQQYLADGFGALMGGVAAVAYSYAVYKLQDDGQHCI